MGGLKLGKEAQAKFDEAKTKPDKQGILDKKGAKRKNWNERYFVLKENYLFYCKNKTSNPQGIINLHGCTVSKIEGPTARPHSFSLLAPKSVSIDAKWTNRTYFMAAKDPKEMDHWMEILDSNGKKAVERAAQKKKEDEKKTDEKKEDKEMEVTGKDSSSDSEKEEKKKSPESDSDKEEPKKVEEKKRKNQRKWNHHENLILTLMKNQRKWKKRKKNQKRRTKERRSKES